MKYDDVEILFVEDSSDDAILTIRALSKSGFANKLHHVIDGAAALDFLYCRGIYAGRSKKQYPKRVCICRDSNVLPEGYKRLQMSCSG